MSGYVTGSPNIESTQADSLLQQVGNGESATRSSRMDDDAMHEDDGSLTPEMSHLFRLLRQKDEQGAIRHLRANFNEEGFGVTLERFDGLTALCLAVKLELTAVVKVMLELCVNNHCDVAFKDEVLIAVRTGNLVITRMLLDYMKQTGRDEHKPPEIPSSEYTPDVTPLILACMENNYQMVRLLVKRDHTLPLPHRKDCGCEECVKSRADGEVMEVRLARLHAYQAVTSPAFLCAGEQRPILTAFQLSQDVLRSAELEAEWKTEYEAMHQQLQSFTAALLSECHTEQEVMMILEEPRGYIFTATTNIPRLRVALDSKHKQFVAHPKCQAVLDNMWMRSWCDWEAKRPRVIAYRIFLCTVMYPILSLMYLFAPRSLIPKPTKIPFARFVSHCTSYVMFIAVMVYQAIVGRHSELRGPPAEPTKWYLLVYVLGLLWWDCQKVYNFGLVHYFSMWWHWFDVFELTSWVITIHFWFFSWMDITYYGLEDLDRSKWDTYDGTLLSEAFFSLSTILTCWRISYFLQMNRDIGPLIVSVQKCVRVCFMYLALFFILILSFTVGLNFIYHPYQKLETHETRTKNQFYGYISALKALYWSLYGYTPPEHAYIPVKDHWFTQMFGGLLLASYYIMVIIIAINLIIAMMSNEASEIMEKADIEWKFVRVELMAELFEDDAAVPPPFNLIPSIRTIKEQFQIIRNFCLCRGGTCVNWGFEMPKRTKQERANYKALMATLIQRYLTKKASAGD